MKHKWIFYLMILAATVVLISFQGGALSYGLFFAVVLYPAVSVIYTLFSWGFLHIWQELPEIRVKKGEETDYRLVLENSGFLPIPWLKLTYRNDVSEMKQPPVTLALKARERREFMIPSTFLYAGTYQIGILSVDFSDPFSFFHFSFHLKSEFRCIVLPRITETAAGFLRDLPETDHSKLLNPYQRTLPGVDIRPYQKGDLKNSIRWNLYAHTGELYVREREPAENEYHTFVCVPMKDPEELPEIQRRDRFLEFTVSLVTLIVRQSLSVRILLPRGKWEQVDILTMRDLQHFLEQITERLYLYEETEIPAEEGIVLIREEVFT